MRYRNILFLILGIGVVAVLAELGFRTFLPQYSITQRSGPGQITLYAISLVAILWFTASVARISPVAFLAGYGRDWRRVVGGFAVMFLVGMIAMLLLHLSMGAFGTARFNQQAWDTMSAKIWERTAVGMFAVVVLATTEELIFRSFLLRYLRWNDTVGVTVAAVVVSSAIFALLHVIALQSAIRQPDYPTLLLGLFMLGLLLGTIYVATGSVACAIGMHAGLLGFKVIQRKTNLVTYSPDWFFGIRDNGYDLRSGPGIWLSLLVAAGLFVLWRYWLRRRFWIETVVAVEPKRGQGIGFRLEGASTALSATQHPNSRTQGLGAAAEWPRN